MLFCTTCLCLHITNLVDHNTVGCFKQNLTFGLSRHGAPTSFYNSGLTNSKWLHATELSAHSWPYNRKAIKAAPIRLCNSNKLDVEKANL